jgi:hypothetical protein
MEKERDMGVEQERETDGEREGEKERDMGVEQER